MVKTNGKGRVGQVKEEEEGEEGGHSMACPSARLGVVKVQLDGAAQARAQGLVRHGNVPRVEPLGDKGRGRGGRGGRRHVAHAPEVVVAGGARGSHTPAASGCGCEWLPLRAAPRAPAHPHGAGWRADRVAIMSARTCVCGAARAVAMCPPAHALTVGCSSEHGQAPWRGVGKRAACG